MATIEDIKKLKEEYTSTSVDFEGNDETEAFYGHIEDFKLDADNSIIVVLSDMENEYFDIDWEEVKDSEFDQDDYIVAS